MAPSHLPSLPAQATTFPPKKSSAMASLLQKSRAFLTPRSLSPSVPEYIFPSVSKEVDGEDCDHDCETCEVRLPRGWKLDEDEPLYGHVKKWSKHILVGTGKTDWVRDVSDEKGSVMEAIEGCKVEPGNGKLMLSASNIPTSNNDEPPADRPTTVLLLPAFIFIENVTPNLTSELIARYVAPAPTNTTPLSSPFPSSTLPDTLSPLTPRPCPHKYLILLCSHRTRDARCGQSAPLLKREFERNLRPLGLHRDERDEREGGVGIYFISHVGGHKFSANVMIYRRADAVLENTQNKKEEVPEERMKEGAQCIWLARVRPEHCEQIIKYTVLQGKVVHPQRQLRGGFDRGKGLVSW